MGELASTVGAEQIERGERDNRGEMMLGSPTNLGLSRATRFLRALEENNYRDFAGFVRFRAIGAHWETRKPRTDVESSSNATTRLSVCILCTILYFDAECLVQLIVVLGLFERV